MKTNFKDPVHGQESTSQATLTNNKEKNSEPCFYPKAIKNW